MAIDTAAKRYSALNVLSPWRGLNYFPTGAVPQAERQAVIYLYSGILAVAPVAVPNVVGETQAAATTDITNAGLVLGTVTSQYSDSVAAGLVISQLPTAGTLVSLGSSVSIVLSLGPQPVDADQPSGGWLFRNLYEAEKRRREAERRRRKELEEETERIEAEVDREIARAERAIERNEQREAELERLREISAHLDAAQAEEAYGERVAASLERAVRQGNRAALEALDRQLQVANDELEAHLRAVRLILMEGD